MAQLFQRRHMSLWAAAVPSTLPTRAAARAAGAAFPSARPRAQAPLVAAAAAVGLSPEVIKEAVEEIRQYTSCSKPISKFGFQRGLEDKYLLGRKLGSGTCGIVHVGIHKETLEKYAVKILHKRFGPDGFLDAQFVRQVRNEVDIHNKLGRCLNVCYLYDTFESESSIFMVLDLCSGGQLWDRIVRPDAQYSERQAARLVREILRPVALCHANNIMLRDIKPQNFLFAGPEENAPLKAVDFGIAVFCKPFQYITKRAGTRVMMAPEVVQERYTLSADLWSVGILAYLLLTGRLPFKGSDLSYKNRDIFHDVLHTELDFDSPPWDTLTDAKDLVQSLLNRDETQRPTAAEALQHRWLQDMQGQKGQDVPLGSSVVQRLQRFGTYGRLKQAALRTVAIHLDTESEIVEDLRGLFLELDPLDCGRVPYSKLNYWLQEGRFSLTPREAQQLMAQIDVDQDGKIRFESWIASLMDWSKLHGTSEWDALVERAFNSLDTGRTGRIGMEELAQLLCGDDPTCEVATKLGLGSSTSLQPRPVQVQIPQDLTDSALREADTDGDGTICLSEFRTLLESQLQDRLDLFESRISEGC